MNKVVEVLGAHYPLGPMVISCEHASKALPAGMAATDRDRQWLQTHWGWDIGAREVTQNLVELTGSVAVCSKISRLVSDANRDPKAPTWIRTEVEGEALSFNQGLSATEREERRLRYHAPYHQVLDEVLAQRMSRGGDLLLFSVHSFTPDYMGQKREMEMGVVFDNYDAVAKRFANLLSEEGYKTALNAPYSGYEELIYSANRHGRKHDVLYLELEIRQDLIATPEQCAIVADRLNNALTRLRLRQSSRPQEARP